MLIVDSKVREMIFANTPAQEIRKYAMSAGMTTLYQDGLDKGHAGIHDLRRGLSGRQANRAGLCKPVQLGGGFVCLGA